MNHVLPSLARCLASDNGDRFGERDFFRTDLGTVLCTAILSEHQGELGAIVERIGSFYSIEL